MMSKWDKAMLDSSSIGVLVAAAQRKASTTQAPTQAVSLLHVPHTQDKLHLGLLHRSGLPQYLQLMHGHTGRCRTAW